MNVVVSLYLLVLGSVVWATAGRRPVAVIDEIKKMRFIKIGLD